jgi:hypothetical protein
VCRYQDWETGADEGFVIPYEFKQSYQSFMQGFGNYFWQPVYMSPSENALVLCVDEKSQIQALQRSQPVL